MVSPARLKRIRPASDLSTATCWPSHSTLAPDEVTIQCLWLDGERREAPAAGGQKETGFFVGAYPAPGMRVMSPAPGNIPTPSSRPLRE